jgi:tape measure domain-containing protein
VALRDIFVHFGVQVDQQPLIDAQRNVNSLVIRFAQLQRIAGFALAALGTSALTDAFDQYANLTNRLRAVTKGTEEFAIAQQGVFDVARKTYTPVEDVAALYQRFTLVTDHLGKSQGEVLGFTEQLTMAMKLGGSTASEARGALIQFGQGLGNNFKSGGQELNSIIEQAPELAKILADAAGGSVAQLKTLAKEGKLTADKVFAALKNAAPELERRFVQRAKSFEDVKIAFGIEWLALMKQLEPILSKIIRHLLDLVTWTKEWVEKGEAMNTIITVGIIVVGALAFAFGALAANLLLTLAPFIALYLVIEDFVTFMRGGDSIIGRFFEKIFGEGGAEKARVAIGEVWTSVKEFFAWLADPARVRATWEGFYNSAVEWVGKAIEWVKNKVPELAAVIAQTMRNALGDKASDFLGIASAKDLAKDKNLANSPDLQQGKDEYENALAMRDAGVQGDKSRIDWAMRTAAGESPVQKTWTDRLKESLWSSGESPLPAWDPMKGPMLPTPKVTASVTTAPWVPGGSAAPVVTNNITVQGNATPEVARQIGKESGNATSAALGRDNSAIGASFGMAQ